MCASPSLVPKFAAANPVPCTATSPLRVFGAALGVTLTALRNENALDIVFVPALVLTTSGRPVPGACIGVIAVNVVALTGMTSIGEPPSVAVIEPGEVGKPLP